MDDKEKSIDSSISSLNEYINANTAASKLILKYLLYYSIGIALTIAALYFFPYISGMGLEAASEISPPISLMYAILALFVVVFGVLMAIYRFHLNEIARSEHYKIGFLRIRVAANNYDLDGFGSEVRVSLTHDAFLFSAPSFIGSKDKKIESLLPGYPTSDITAILLNKLLDGVEVKKK